MKRLIFSALAFCVASFTYGQVTDSEGDVAPTSSQVAALPGAAADANTGTSIQNGDDNRVRVRQAGTRQSVYTNQNNGDGTGGNLARIMQTGEVQAGSGVENFASVMQSGSENQSTVQQEGDFNNAYMAQGQNDAGSSGNRGYIRQGDGQQAEANYAAMEQDGADNQATIYQTFDNSDAWTRQNGEANKSEIWQNAGPNQTDGHEAWNLQDGDRNESYVNQSGAGARNRAAAAQDGDDNQARQVQTTSAGAGGTGNFAGISQVYGYISSVPLYNGLLNSIIDRTGFSFGFFSGGQSFGAKAYQQQSGEGQEAYIIQLDGTADVSNYAEQNQSGEYNDASILQTANSGEAWNYAKQYQNGENNYAGAGQGGDGNKVLQTQMGDGNFAESSQRGDYNLLNMHQRGNGNAAIADQAGTGNVGLIVQNGGQSYLLQQGLDPFGTGMGNQADILQLGPDGDFGADGIDCYFDMPVDIPALGNVPSFDLPDICPDCN